MSKVMRSVSIAILLLAGLVTDAAAQTALGTMSYIREVMSNDLFEMNAAKLAFTKAQDRNLKTIAGHTVKDFNASPRQFADAIKRGNIGDVPPAELSDGQKAELALLGETSGGNFDRLYVSTIRTSREAMLKLHQAYAETGANAELRDMAASFVGRTSDQLRTIREFE